MTGRLVLVATPIGNLGDLSPRSVEELDRSALICCEDTRRTGKLLAHAGVSGASLLRVDDHTEVAAIDRVKTELAADRQVAVVTDAGMPGISDPGERLVRAVAADGYEVSVVPGPSAALAALVASGLPTGRFAFEGFLPRKGSGRTARLAEIAGERRTVVLYESPHRVAQTLADLAEVCGPERRAAVAREITKLHEEFVRGTLAELTDWSADGVRGEVVVVVDGAPPPPLATDAELTDALRAAVRSGRSKRDATADVAATYAVAKRRVYDLVLRLDTDDVQGGAA